jgi:hypothetical protein
MSNRTLLTLAAALALVSGGPARADVGGRRLEVAPVAGAFIPLSGARQEFDTAPLVGVQVVRDLDPHVALVATFAWAPTAALRLGGADLDLFQYDLGLRGQHAFAAGSGVTLRPFLGVGVGLATFSFRDPQLEGGTNWTNHATLGLEVSRGAVTASVAVRHQILRPTGASFEHDATLGDLQVFASAGVNF